MIKVIDHDLLEMIIPKDYNLLEIIFLFTKSKNRDNIFYFIEIEYN